MMNQTKFEELCASFALGALDDNEKQELLRELEESRPEQLETLKSYMDTAEHLPAGVEQTDPPEHIRAAIFKEIGAAPATEQQQDEATPPRQIAPPAWIRAAAVFLAAVCLVLLYFTLNLNSERIELAETVEQQRFEILDLRDRVQVAERYLEIIGSRNTYLVSMDGLEPSPSGFGRVFYDPESRAAILQVANLPASPPDKDYQLWVIREGTPVSAGLFSLDVDDQKRYFVLEDFFEEDFEGVDAVAITLEPEGGVPQPTGDMFLLGSPS